MLTLSDSEPSSPTNPLNPEMDIEPDDEWKKILKARISRDLQSMTKEVKDAQMAELRKSNGGPEDQKRFEEEYKSKMESITEVASDQYQIELEKERNKRRWAAGEPMLPGWSKYLEQEQQHAMDSYKHSREPPVSPTYLQATFRSLSRASRRSFSSTVFPTGADDIDIEPNEEWKRQLRERIQAGFQPKIQHAKDKKLLDTRNGQMSAEEIKRIEDDFKAAMENVRTLANDEFQTQLDKERSKRREALLAQKPSQRKSDDLDDLWTDTSEYSMLSPPPKDSSRSSEMEPDEVWKDKLRARINADHRPMMNAVNENHFNALQKAAEAIAQLDLEYKADVNRIRAMSESRYESELARERLRLRGIADTEGASDNEGSEESEESEEGDKDKEKEATTREKQEKLRRLVAEAEKREAELSERERDLLRRDKKLERRQSETKKKEDSADTPEGGKMKDERVKWKDFEAEAEPEAEDPRIAAAEKAQRKQDAIDAQFRGYDGGDFHEEDFDDPDPKTVEEQSYIWQQLQYQQQADMIQRRRKEQRARNDSMGSDNPSTGSPSSSPVVSKMPQQIPQFLPPPVNRNHVPVTPWAPAGFTIADAVKPPPSPSMGRKPSLLAMGIPVPGTKPRNGSVSSGGSIPGNLASIPHAPSPAPRNIPIVVPPNNLYARVAMVKTSSSQDSPL